MKVERVKQQSLQLPVGLDSFVCPECGTTRNLVIDSRQVNERRRRRRMCVNAHRFTTYELDAVTLSEIEQKLAEFREWQAQMRDMLRLPAA